MNIVSLSVAHCAVLSKLHGESFQEAWSEKSFADLIGLPASFGFVAVEDNTAEPMGFILCQGDAIEAEIITIATRPARRRSGVAQALLGEACAQSGRMFLEVARDNDGALSFYRKHGFTEIAVRKDYYKRAEGPSVDALVMEWTNNG